VLGRGGTGTVYEAEQADPKRRVAVKVLHRWLVTARAAERFRFEAAALAALLHPGVPQIYAIGDDGTRLWFAMELVRGAPITTWAEQRALDRSARVAILAAVCDAVHHAHLRGFVHRDLKPANVLVTDEGQPKVLDFGIAAAGERAAADLAGTRPYMSPEQLVRGAPVDLRADVFALGVMAWELLTGSRPGLETRGHGAGLDADLDAILLRSTAPSPADRYASAADLAADLRAWRAGRPVSAVPWTRGYVARRFVGRHPLEVGLAVALAAALIGGGVVARAYALETRATLLELRAEQARRALGSGEPEVAAEQLAELMRAGVDGPAIRFLAGRVEDRLGPVLTAPVRHFAPYGSNALSLVGLDAEGAWDMDPARRELRRVALPDLPAGADASRHCVWPTAGGIAWIDTSGTARVHDRDGALVRAFETGEPDRCWPAGERALVASGDGALRSLDLAADSATPLGSGPSSPTAAVAADGSFLVVGRYDPVAILGDLERGLAERVDLGCVPGVASVVAAGDGLWVHASEGCGIQLVGRDGVRALHPPDRRWTAVGPWRDLVLVTSGREAVAVDPRRERIVAHAPLPEGDPNAVSGDWLFLSTRAEGAAFLDLEAALAPAEPLPAACTELVLAGDRALCIEAGPLRHAVTAYDRGTGDVLGVREGPAWWYGFDYPRPDATGARIAVADADGKGHPGVWAPGGEDVVFDRDGTVNDLAWAPDGRLALAAADGAVEIWTAAGERAAELGKADTAVFVLAWSPDGRTLAGGASDGHVWLWDAAGGPPKRIGQLPGYVNALAWSDDGARVAASGRGLRTVVWDVRTGTAGPEIVGHLVQVSRIGFLPDGLVWTSERAGPVAIWDPATGDLLQDFDGATSPGPTPDGAGLHVLQGSLLRTWDVTPFTGTADTLHPPREWTRKR
jgi:tRNA A-37 threonylcarbamoyl transferase component Bud32